jgi:hypothetical protein
MIRFLLLMFLAVPAFAAPFVVADVPAAACNQCVWTGFGGALVSSVVVDTVRGSPAFGNRICLRDMAAAPVGTNTVILACRDSTSVWGDSVTVPFSFVRSAPPLQPADLRIVP